MESWGPSWKACKTYHPERSDVINTACFFFDMRWADVIYEQLNDTNAHPQRPGKSNHHHIQN
jgi:hypothetical protein